MSYHYQKPEPNYGDSYEMPRSGGGYRDEPQSAAYNNNQYPMTSPAATSSPYALPQKKKRNKWLWIGLPLLLLAIIIGAVVGGVVGSRKSGSSTNAATGTTSGGGSGSGSSSISVNTVSAGVGSTATNANGQAYLAIATNTYMLPQYPTGTATSGYIAPTVIATPASTGAWPADPSPPSSSSPRAHPRLIAPKYKWDALKNGLIAADPYLKYWNATIIANATRTLNDAPQPYTLDGGLSGSGVLDPARVIKMKVKNWAYAYQITGNAAFADRVFLELQTAAGNNSAVSFGTDNSRWNPAHFLDLAEFCSAFAIGYDWLYDYWSTDQKNAIMWSILNLGLSYGNAALTNAASASTYSWWAGPATNNAVVAGNWNCVINGGLTMAALAVVGDDPTGLASSLLALTVPDAQANCLKAVRDDGTWAETTNYWYFGTTGAAELISALTTTYGSDSGLLASNPAWNLTSLAHIYSQGMTSLFNYGDHGPNKYSATANSLMLWGDIFNQPRYTLYQRDQYDSSEPWSMFWYNPAVSGAWWDGLPLDRHFSNANGDNWVAMRSSWTNTDGVYLAMKAGYAIGHQTHGDLDMGDFVLDALGQRWAGELGSGQYLSTEYFQSEAQDADRWLYYRKRTEGQNTILLNYANQLVPANATTLYGSTGEAQGAAPGYTPPSTSTGWYTADISQAYSGATVKRGIRMINGRTQVLLQDDISGATSDIQWRMHTNATMSFGTGNTTVTLSLGGKSLIASIIQGPSGAKFTQLPATRFANDPSVPSSTDATQQALNNDQPNDPTTVLAITVAGGGTFSLQVLFNPQYSGATSSTFKTPPNVAIGSWSTTSHN